MYLFVFEKTQSNFVKLYDLLEKNKSEIATYDRFDSIINEDFWFALCTQNDEIIAECFVSKKHSFCLDRLQYYHITDLFVPELFRGNNYAMLLILNILYHFDQLNDPTGFRIEAYCDNIPAYRSYSKIFGEPLYIFYQKAYFSSY